MNLHSKITKNRGASVPEIILVVAILAIMVGLTYASFSNISDYNTVDKHSAVIQYQIERARQATINSKNDDNFGIRFTSSTVNVFQGTTYTTASSVAAISIPSGVSLQSISLTSGVNTIYFQQITGEPSATGTIIFRSTKKASTTKSITVYGTGHSEVQ